MTYQAFDAHADEYDAWYDSEPGKSIYALEVECLRPLLHSYPRPYLEVGVGSGRFARVLGIEYGVDPSPVLLEKAKSRGINVWIANGEKLPFPEGASEASLPRSPFVSWLIRSGLFRKRRECLYLRGGLCLV